MPKEQDILLTSMPIIIMTKILGELEELKKPGKAQEGVAVWHLNTVAGAKKKVHQMVCRVVYLVCEFVKMIQVQIH